MKIKSLFAVPLGVAIITLLLFSCPTSAQTQTSIHDLDNPARQPFQLEIKSQRLADRTTITTIPLLTVPTGKRLVIEQVFAEVVALCSAGDPEPFFVAELQTKAGGQVANHDLAFTRRAKSVFGEQDYVASQLTRIYADPASKISLRVFLVDGSTNCYSVASLNKSVLSGHFVDVNQP